MVALSRPYHLLIADDDAGFRETLRAVFEPHFVTIEAATGEEAVELVEREQVDIALFDMHMPRLTGLEALRILSARDLLPPSILITADPTEELRRDAAEARAFSVMGKPIARLELVRTVSRALAAAYAEWRGFPFGLARD
ncbi:MAG: response regulator [Planctomycetales bacterium]